eukprot:210932-Ditylum_brightwellii.AAC.1
MEAEEYGNAIEQQRWITITTKIGKVPYTPPLPETLPSQSIENILTPTGVSMQMYLNLSELDLHPGDTKDNDSSARAIGATQTKQSMMSRHPCPTRMELFLTFTVKNTALSWNWNTERPWGSPRSEERAT